MLDIRQKAANALRILSADQVQKANSGHPGAPLGCAGIASELWANHLKIYPNVPKWENRDRFILSMGHASALIYSLLHVFGYGVELSDLKNFRQTDSLTPGHPEYGHTVGIEATTGPLGAGLGMAVGMAMAEKHLGAVFNKDGFDMVDHYTYVLAGDGCMMEGISYEVGSLAGTLALDKLIIIYDSNNISIEGNTNIAFREDVRARYESFGFHTLEVEDGNDLDQIAKAIEIAKATKGKPSLIVVKTKIGYGCPAKEGSASAHGEPLGVDNVSALRENLGWESKESFEVPSEIYDWYNQKAKAKAEAYDSWLKLQEDYFKAYPEMEKLWNQYFHTDVKAVLDNDEGFWTRPEKTSDATRNISGNILNQLKAILPNFFGGSADLAPSNKSFMAGLGEFSAETPEGQNIHFGVRELGMSAIANGILLHGGLLSYIATFFVFSDYTKPMLRLSSLMKIPQICIFTHDSIGVGEDGATHEPIEQAAMLRSMPNFYLFRPADSLETACAWYVALTNGQTPTALALTRQNVLELANSSKEALKGGYILAKENKEVADGILIASGSEVALALEARESLLEKGIDVRVVSMPCMDLFAEQEASYQEFVLPKNVRKRVVIEALGDFGWGKYVGLDGAYVTMSGFGASGPAAELFKKFGFTVENVVRTFESLS